MVHATSYNFQFIFCSNRTAGPVKSENEVQKWGVGKSNQFFFAIFVALIV